MTPFPQFEQYEPSETAAQLAQYWRTPIGAMSPLWALYAGVASMGAAYWWASQWMKPANLEAFGSNLPALLENENLPAVMETVAALQPEPAAPPEDPAIDPEAPEAELASAAVQTAGEIGDAVVEATGEAAQVMNMAADDLTRLAGIGPTLAARLGNLGVTTFADIAAWTEDDLAKVDKALDLKGRAVREAWIDQARQFTAQTAN